MFEVGKRYAEYGSDWKQFEIISRKGNSITYVKIQHTEQYNELARTAAVKHRHAA